jgi:hypothetical protein
MISNAFWVALLIAVVLTAVFVWGFRVRGAWGNGLAFFAIVFLASWAAGTWVRPLGAALPVSTPWVSELIVGLVVALLMASSTPTWARRAQQAAVAAGATPIEAERRAPPITLLTPAYWIALAVLVVAVIVR